MDDTVLLVLAITGIWTVPLCWLGVLGVRETIDWWHRRRQRGTHHPCTPTARMVWEIDQRLRREATRPTRRRSIAVHSRVLGTTPPLPPAPRPAPPPPPEIRPPEIRPPEIRPPDLPPPADSPPSELSPAEIPLPDIPRPDRPPPAAHVPKARRPRGPRPEARATI